MRLSCLFYCQRSYLYKTWTHVHLKHISITSKNSFRNLRKAFENFIQEQKCWTTTPERILTQKLEAFTVFTVRHTAHCTLILLVSMYMLLGYCQVRSFNIIQFIILCNVTAILIFFVVKLEEEALQCWLVKLIYSLIIVTLLILEHATGTKSSSVRAVWRLTSVTAETELTNGDSLNKNNSKKNNKKKKSPFPHLNNLLLLY